MNNEFLFFSENNYYILDFTQGRTILEIQQSPHLFDSGNLIFDFINLFPLIDSSTSIKEVYFLLSEYLIITFESLDNDTIL